MLEKKISIGVSALLSNSKGDFLFLKRSGNNSWGVGEWQLPEGKPEWGETPIQALKREILEETGCKVKKLELVGTSASQLEAKGFDYWVVRIIFKGKIKGKIKLDKDHSDYAFWNMKKALKQELAHGVRKALKELKQ